MSCPNRPTPPETSNHPPQVNKIPSPKETVYAHPSAVLCASTRPTMSSKQSHFLRSYQLRTTACCPSPGKSHTLSAKVRSETFLHPYSPRARNSPHRT